MATDFSKPVVTDAYATLLPGLVTANKDLAMMLEPTLTGTSTNVPTGAVRWNATTIRWERYNGSSWAVLAATYAISISGNAATATSATTAAACTGNAATATKLATARTIGGVSFDGSASISLPGVNATGNQNTTGNAATATTAAACTGNAATATTAATAPWSGITGKPTTVAGYGIGDMGSQSVNYAATAGNGGVTSVNGMTGPVTINAEPTTEVVGTALAGLAAYAVGSYVIGTAASSPTNSSLSANSTVSGSQLFTMGVSSSYALVSSGVTAVGVGTWRLMHSVNGASSARSGGLYLRIA